MLHLKNKIGRENIKVGERINSYSCGEFTVINRDSSIVTVEFATGYRITTSVDNAVSGYIKDPLHPSVFGIGYFGVGNYKSREDGRITREYRAWSNMMERCYNLNQESMLKRQPWYSSVEVDPFWHNFQNFAEWYVLERKIFDENNIHSVDLDKDILSLNTSSKIYSPGTCCLLPSEINGALIKSERDTGGVIKRKNSYSVINNNKKVIASKLASKEEAVQIYKKEKQKILTDLANKYIQVLNVKVYNKLCNWYHV